MNKVYPMHGIVSLLDETHTDLVNQLWEELKRRFGVGNPAATFVPHFSYQVAAGYAVEKVEEILADVARETAVFTTRAEGIALFPSEMNIIYIPVVRNLALTQLHERLWTAVSPHSQGSVLYYTPPRWFPHITLAHDDITPDNLGPIVAWMHSQTIAWTITVDNLALVSDENGRHSINRRFTFGG